MIIVNNNDFFHMILGTITMMSSNLENESSISRLRKAEYPQENGSFGISFINETENNLSKKDVTYIFSKFGPVSGICYTENGRVYVYYQTKQAAEKACEVLNMGTKYHVEITAEAIFKANEDDTSKINNDLDTIEDKSSQNIIHEVLVINPGLRHLVEKVFLHLDVQSLLNCRLVCIFHSA